MDLSPWISPPGPDPKFRLVKHHKTFLLQHSLFKKLDSGLHDIANLTCLGHLGQRDTDRIVSISCRVAQGGQGKYCLMSLSLTVSLTNYTNVNDK